MTIVKKLALVSRADAAGGGASRVADDIYRGFLDSSSLEITRFVGEKIGVNENIPYQWVVDRNKKKYYLAKKIFNRKGFIDYYPLERIGLNKEIINSDIVHVHDISSILAPSILGWLKQRGVRVMWTMHDMSPITAGCLYPVGCDRWKSTCDSCPQLGNWPLLTHQDKTSKLQLSRLELLKSGLVELISPSKWLAENVQALIPNVSVHIIPNGVDTEAYQPRATSVSFLDGMKTPRLVFIANHLNDVRKGALYLAEIRDYLNAAGKDLHLTVVGNAHFVGRKVMGRLEIDFIGHVSSRIEMNKIFNKSHGLLLPTHADNFPLVMLEAMASGCAVFSFNTGGITEAVDEACGAIVPAGDICGLLNKFFLAFEAGKTREQGMEARLRVERNYGMNLFISKHEGLYLNSH